MKYTNYKCPVCNNQFTENDDVVVCPECGTPHHRECYKQNGKCKNAELHGTGFKWEATATAEANPQPVNPQPNPNPVFNQTQNPNQNQNYNPFTNYSTPFPPPPQNNPLNLFPQELEEGVSTTDVATFVQYNGIRYVQKFFYVKGGKRTVNWAALFFAPYWFFYRKMHKLGAIFMALMLALSLMSLLPPVQRITNANYEYMEQLEVISTMDPTSEEAQTAQIELYTDMMNTYKQNYLGLGLTAFQGIASLIIRIYIALNANKWYYQHVTREIKKVNGENFPPEKRTHSIYKAGGTAYGIAFLSVLIGNIFVLGFDMLLSIILK
jgi:DNA-directed RNA polymerase subunit RPC12/RpoP